MLDRKTRPLWHLLVSWVLIVLMIASVGEVATLSLGGAVASQDDIDIELFDDDDDTDIFDDDPNDNGDDDDDDDPNDNGDDPNIVRNITFELDRDPIDIHNITTIENPQAFLLHGVRALDEGGNAVEVTIECHGESLLDNGRFDLERLLPGAYFTVVYRATHPVTDIVFTTYRRFNIPTEIVHALRFYFAEGAHGVSLENIHNISSPMQFLHEGVTVLDENNVSIEFVITDFDRIIFTENGRYYFNLELMQPGEIFTLVYSAAHPTTGDIFSAQRRFYVSAAMMMHSVTFEVDEYRVTIDNILEIENPVEFLLTGMSAVDENDEELAIEIIDTDGLLIDSSGIVEVDGERVFVNMGTELPTEDGTKSIAEDPYQDGSVFNLDEIQHQDEFVVTFMAVHPEDPTVYETVERVFVVPFNLEIGGFRNTVLEVRSGDIVTIVNGADIIAAVIVHPGGTLNMTGGTISTVGVEMRGGVFNMSGGEIRDTPTAVNLINAGAEFNMSGGRIHSNATNAARSPGVNITAGTFTLSAQSYDNYGIIENNTHTWALNTNDGGVGVRLTGASSRFYMEGGAIRNNIHPAGIGGGVHVRDGATFTMSGGIISGNTAGRNSIGTGESGGGGVAVLGSGRAANPSSFIMTGGEISGNRTRTSGGGVSVRGPHAVFEMSGDYTIDNGTRIYSTRIYDNEATSTRTGRGIGGAGYYSGGGGVWVYGANATFNMNGGIIEHNRTGGYYNSWHIDNVPASGERTSASWNALFAPTHTGTGGQNQNGGGVFALRNAHFNMHGGTISHNVAGDLLRFWQGDWNRLYRGGTYHGGGGIATRNHGRVNITGNEDIVRITHNRSPSGGGIYVDNWSQVTIGGAYNNVYIEHNIAYGRIFSNLLGWDGRGGGGIATGDGLYYGGRYHANPVAGNPPFDEFFSGRRHDQTAVCVLDGTFIRYNISGGDGGGIYWWASSAVRMDDERYLHGLRVTEGARVEYNLAYAGAVADFTTLEDNYGRLFTVYGRIDDGLNNRHNLTPRRRVATSVVRNGRINPGGMWLDPTMAEYTRIAGRIAENNYVYFAGYGHHAFNNHDIRTVGGVRWPRPELEPPTRYYPMQDIQQGRVQLEIVGPDGAPAPGSDTAFPNVDMGDITVSVTFSNNQFVHTPAELPGTTAQNEDEPHRVAYRWIRNNNEFRAYIGALPENISINNNSPLRSSTREVYSVLPHDFRYFDNDGNEVSENAPDATRRPVDAAGNRVNARTHHGMEVSLRITHPENSTLTHRVTKVEVFGACGCRVVDRAWANVVRPPGWVDGYDYNEIPDGWAPGPYLLNHFCLTHRPPGHGANLSYAPTAGGRLPPGLRVGVGVDEGTLVNQDLDLPSPGDLFHFEGCLACRDENYMFSGTFNPLGTLIFGHTLRFLDIGQPYPFRPSPGFGAYGLVFRVTVEPVPQPEILRLGVIGGSIDFGTHDIVDLISKDTRYIRLVDDLRNDPTPYSTDPQDVGFTVYDSRQIQDRAGGWRVEVQADCGSLLSSMLRLHGGSGHSGQFIGDDRAVEIFNHNTDAPNCTTCYPSTTCICATSITRVTWKDLIRLERDIVVDLGVNPARIPAELHRAVLTWTVIGETPGENLPDALRGEPRITTGWGLDPDDEMLMIPWRLQEHITFYVDDWLYGTLETEGERPDRWYWDYANIPDEVLYNAQLRLNEDFLDLGLVPTASTPPGLTFVGGTAGGVMSGQLAAHGAFVFRATARNDYNGGRSDFRYFLLVVLDPATQPNTQRRRTIKLKLKIANQN